MLKELIEREEIHQNWVNSNEFSKLTNKELCSKLINFKWNLPNHDKDWKIWIENNYTEILINEFPNEFIELLSSLLIVYKWFSILDWKIISIYFRLLQKFLPSNGSRVCPICGSLKKTKFEMHLEYHNVTKLNYIVMLNNLGNVPKCGNPKCNNEVHETYHYGLTSYCSIECQYSCNNFHSLSNGLKLLNSYKLEIIKLYLDGIMITDIKNIIDVKIDISHYRKLIHDEVGYRYSYIRYMGSYPEHLLGDILFKLNINFIHDKPLKINDKYKVRPDYYLIDYNVILECDGNFKYKDENGNYMYDDSGNYKLQDKYVSRKHFIESYTGIRVINIKQDMVYYYNNHKRDLLKLINKLEYPLVIIY